MPVTFAQIAADTASVTIQTGVGPVTIVYYPNKLTEISIAEVQVSKDSDAFLAEIIKSWDIVEDEESGVMFPISNIDKFGIAFKAKIIDALTNDIRPNQIAPQA